MKVSNDISPANWLLKGSITNYSPNQAGSIFPIRFNRYFKLFLPIGIYNENLKRNRRINYSELAELIDSKYNKSFSISEIFFQKKTWPEGFNTGEFDLEFMDDLFDLLNREEPVYFYGSGDDLVPEKFEAPYIIQDNLEILPNLVEQLNFNNDWTLFNFYPRNIFDKNKTWSIGWNVDIHEVGILILGCNDEIGSRIISQSNLDFEELNPGDYYLNFGK
jgi:hypothetical protein